MVYKLYLVNHTQYEYVDMCRSNFSQERCMFIVPESWDGNNDDMEVMTEFVFREKLKNRKKYSEVEMFPDPGEEDEEANSDEEDLKDDERKKYLADKKGGKSKDTSKDEPEDEEEENEEEDEEVDEEELAN